MSATLQHSWTHDDLLDRAERQEESCEFDSTETVSVNSELRNHDLVAAGIRFAVRVTCQEAPWTVLGSGMGVAKTGGAVRFPDPLATPLPETGEAGLTRCAPGYRPRSLNSQDQAAMTKQP